MSGHRHNVSGATYSLPTHSDRNTSSSARDLFDACRNGDITKVGYVNSSNYFY